ncbi:MAG: hypothetical protein HY940_03965 [Gammaproteobacteria bacterium]|nr:hypothetical protein [Gammaproteobacteria bacterium]
MLRRLKQGPAWVAAAALILTLTLNQSAALAGDGSWWQTMGAGSTLSGYYKNETAYRYREPRSFTKIRNILYLDSQIPLASMLDLRAAGWAYHDTVYDLYNYDTIAARAERESIQPLNYIAGLQEQQDNDVAELRELYLDLQLERADLRLGRQFIVWGVMTGVRVVDELNPMDFREMVNLDLMDYRIPLWSARSHLYLTDSSTLELVWIPDIRFHKPAPPGSEWELLQTVPGTIFPDTMAGKVAEYGYKLSTTLLGTELSWSYFDTWDDFPVIFRKVRADEQVEQPAFYPTFSRIKMTGMTVQRPLFGQVIKGELAYVKDKYFAYKSTVDRNRDGYVDSYGEAQADHVRVGIGLDFNLLRTEVSLGGVQWIIPRYDPGLIQPQTDTSINLFIRKELPQRRAVFQMLGIYSVNMNETYLKPRLTFTMTDQLQITGGLDLYSGQGSQVGVASINGRATEIAAIEQRFRFFGNFDLNDRLVMEVKYNF